MRNSRRHTFVRWLAFGPAAFALAGCLAAHAAAGADVHQKVTAAEASILQAIAKRDTALLRRTVGGLGPLIEDALKRKKSGGQVSSCDLAAHSLGFAGMSLSEAVTQKGAARKMLMDDARQAAADFNRDMSACDAQVGQKTSNHAGVEKALRAL
ncbi:hypothetical protein [Agrobacterium vitis]|uniref:hypothetical protein n=1 Tax=Agrobacterium vitis TaxID=373 RepID=UPI0012E991B3|nr:hypothetical protein [Agrobacterium vitis]MVA71302.1 hypothetical protein [Agrobacterium vitis]NSZ15387.1 hypothetical protein [Agrobacterium vitis]QZO04249.1 hypothetical protein K4831_01325 [Agrobacterium vitis]UJL89378.1 hypothetical protein AVF2S5_16545 [Agrobacterium vitis]BCH57491.1 hypothetical protein RvVAR0630_01150 [Agrobacterium vitis]